MNSRRLFQLGLLLAATALVHSHPSQAQAGSTPPAVVPPAGTPPAGVPPAVTPLAGVPPEGVPPRWAPTPVPPDLAQPPNVNAPNNALPGAVTNGNFNPRFGTNGFDRRHRYEDGDGDADDLLRRWPFDRTNGLSGAGTTGVYAGGTNGVPAAPKGGPFAPR
jgi:hypothetical protein